MLIKYYDNEELAYANRKRYKKFSFEPFNQEIQMSVLLGDGARTSIKTSSENICNYVTIDDTRWYVTSYEYLNGGQVRLNLQRDVVGEFGLSGGFGKIERGYTDGILKFRKELNLNQKLIKRTKLIPSSLDYGLFSVNTHDKEKWGVIYLSKPTDSSDRISINIPEFSPKFIDKNEDLTLDFRYISIAEDNISITIKLGTSLPSGKILKAFHIRIDFYNNNFSVAESTDLENLDFVFKILSSSYEKSEEFAREVAKTILENAKNVYSEFFYPAESKELSASILKYDGSVVKENDVLYRYNIEQSVETEYGFFESRTDFIRNELLNPLFYEKNIVTAGESFFISDIQTYSTRISFYNQIAYNVERIVKTRLSNEDSGIIDVSLNKDLVDEPFFILLCPLFDVEISEGQTKKFSIEKNLAFNVFNKVIQYLSGESSYLVDAQIYPYCPPLSSVGAVLKSGDTSEKDVFPFFIPQSSSFTTVCSIQLMPYSDIKKEYIKREYSMISPDQSNKINFNFYDYTKNIEEREETKGYNSEVLNIYIKTALKPFSIVSSAVLQPKNNSIKGITYESDLRGCNSSGGGFEVSLATDKYQEYIRQNSNYKQFFELQQEQLQRQHDVERVNEKTSAIVNTMTATAMGAIGGASLGAGRFTKTAGAATGASVAGITVGTAMLAQYLENESLRNYEEELQKQTFDLQIGTIKNLPISVNRISSFNEIIMKDFNYIIETYECTEDESFIVDNFIQNYSYGIGVFDLFQNYYKEGWFIRGNIIKSNLITNLHSILSNELKGGIYLYE